MLTGKKVLVLGLARSGKAAIRLLQHLNAKITVNDASSIEKIEEYQTYVNQGIEMICGGHPQELFERDFDFVIKNPGINYHKDFILRLKERNIPIYTEIELGFKFAKPQNYLAITGTNGKTTTVKLLYHIMKEKFPNTFLGGNVGTAFCDLIMDNNLLEVANNYIILEMSNFQLLDIDTFKPKVASIINLTPDHLDYMASLDEYYQSKTRIYLNQDQDDFYVLNIDDLVLDEYLKHNPVKSKIVTLSLDKKADCYLNDNALYYLDEKIIDTKDIKIVGKHNLQNIMVAICFAKIMGVDNVTLKKQIASFNGVEHRIEFVREYKKVMYYNDSKATNTDAVVIALKAFDKPVILLMGGFDKGLDLSDIKEYSSKIKTLITFGAAGKRFKEDMAIEASYCYDSLKPAVKKAMDIAKEGDIVLLSPSTSSFDEFTGMAQRGNLFKEIVLNNK